MLDALTGLLESTDLAGTDDVWATECAEAEKYLWSFAELASPILHRDGYLVPAVETASNLQPVELEGVVVEILGSDELEEGDFEKVVPSIALISEAGRTLLTWEQARALAGAIASVEQTARRG